MLRLVRLGALLADVDFFPQHQTLLNHKYFFYNGNNRCAIFLADWHGTIYHTLNRHTRDCDFVMKLWFINKSFAFMYHLGNADLFHRTQFFY